MEKHYGNTVKTENMNKNRMSNTERAVNSERVGIAALRVIFDEFFSFLLSADVD